MWDDDDVYFNRIQSQQRGYKNYLSAKKGISITDDDKSLDDNNSR
jgi:hypothetical protein